VLADPFSIQIFLKTYKSSVDLLRVPLLNQKSLSLRVSFSITEEILSLLDSTPLQIRGDYPDSRYTSESLNP
jgi:hypothetical protein